MARMVDEAGAAIEAVRRVAVRDLEIEPLQTDGRAASRSTSASTLAPMPRPRAAGAM